MKAIGVIPARYGSTRFPGKPLAMVAGKPLLQWVIEGAQTASKLSEIIVATDDERIATLARSLGVQAAMTDSTLPSGSDRAWAATEHKAVEVVVVIQGDEPLLSGLLLDALIEPFTNDAELKMATLGRLLRPGDLQSSSTAKIALNRVGEALYFSRFPIPYSQVDAPHEAGVSLKHIGIYAYRKHFLGEFCSCGPVALEQAESLEQLRALYLGARIKVVQVDHESWGVDTPEDVKKIEHILRRD
jgi:3-deoxy-manno-octulosonate cytidylyltransferase (CMP-KDO synthetase)